MLLIYFSDEIIAHILSFLDDDNDLFNFTQTCKKFHKFKIDHLINTGHIFIHKHNSIMDLNITQKIFLNDHLSSIIDREMYNIFEQDLFYEKYLDVNIFKNYINYKLSHKNIFFNNIFKLLVSFKKDTVKFKLQICTRQICEGNNRNVLIFNADMFPEPYDLGLPQQYLNNYPLHDIVDINDWYHDNDYDKHISSFIKELNNMMTFIFRTYFHSYGLTGDIPKFAVKDWSKYNYTKK